jgi:DNA-binding response OmpR family regulator
LGNPELSAKLRVLVVDDECVVADTLRIILNQSGFEATVAYSGMEAVEVAKTFQPNILVTDVELVGINGLDVAKLVREILPSCKIFIVSGHATAANLLDEAREQGYEFKFVAKPIHPNQLIAHLRGDIAFEDFA